MHHHSLQLLVFLVPFHLVLTSLHQPLVHRYIKQVNPDKHYDRLLIPRFSRLGVHVTPMSDAILQEKTDSQRPRTQSNNRTVICIV